MTYAQGSPSPPPATEPPSRGPWAVIAVIVALLALLAVLVACAMAAFVGMASSRGAATAKSDARTELSTAEARNADLASAATAAAKDVASLATQVAEAQSRANDAEQRASAAAATLEAEARDRVATAPAVRGVGVETPTASGAPQGAPGVGTATPAVPRGLATAPAVRTLPALPGIPTRVPVVDTPYLGVTYSRLSQGPNVPVTSVVAGSGADAAGVRVGDVITAVDGAPVGSGEDLLQAIAAHHVGDTVTLTIERGSRELTLDAVLGSRPLTPETSGRGPTPTVEGGR